MIEGLRLGGRGLKQISKALQLDTGTVKLQRTCAKPLKADHKARGGSGSPGTANATHPRAKGWGCPCLEFEAGHHVPLAEVGRCSPKAFAYVSGTT